MNTQSHIRQKILEKIGAALQRTKSDASRIANSASVEITFQELTKQLPVANPVAVTEAMNNAELIAHFISAAKLCSTQIERFYSINEARDFMVKQIQSTSLPVFCEFGDLIDRIEWPSDVSTKISKDYMQAGQLGILQAHCAIAETGSVVLMSGAHHAIAAGFLVDTLIVLVRAQDMKLGLEDIWPLIDEQQKKLGMNHPPRSVNIITGPSRTADVEQKVQLGAHGPRHLIVAIINN